MTTLFINDQFQVQVRLQFDHGVMMSVLYTTQNLIQLSSFEYCINNVAKF